MLSLEQDIRAVQRSAMLLERNTDEKWVYGLGIDFSQVNEDSGVYKMFKWCSPFEDYGDVTTKSGLPAYDPSENVGVLLTSGSMAGESNATLPSGGGILLQSTCNGAGSELRTLSGYDRSVRLPASDIVLGDVQYILFESVSGRAFFYDLDGNILNYHNEGVIVGPDSLVHFTMQITPHKGASGRTITVKHLSGKIDTQIND